MLKFNFQVGNTEIHDIEFFFNQFWGHVFIKVDGVDIHKTIKVIALTLTFEYEFNVGVDEIHTIKIEQIRKLFFAGFREYLAKVYVDGALTHEYQGKPNLKEVFHKYI